MKNLSQLCPKNIIVRMPNWVGDVVMAMPVLTNLRSAYPSAQITAMCRSPMGELFQSSPDVNEVFSFTKNSRFVHREEKRNIIAKLRDGHYDLGIILPHTFSSAWWFWQGNIPVRIGYAGAGRDFLLTHSVARCVLPQHLITTYQQVLAPLGIPVSKAIPKIQVQPEEKENIFALLRCHGVTSDHIIIGINPGAAYGSAKCWLPERFRAVTKKLLEQKNVVVVYFGDSVTAPLVKEISYGLSSRVINMAGLTSLRELVALISSCNVLLTNDSGPMHIAGAVNTPVVALFGSTNPVMTGPWHLGEVLKKEVSCSPCYRRTCPIDFRCMTRIQEEEVLASVLRVIAKPYKKEGLSSLGA